MYNSLIVCLFHLANVEPTLCTLLIGEALVDLHVESGFENLKRGMALELRSARSLDVAFHLGVVGAEVVLASSLVGSCSRGVAGEDDLRQQASLL